MSQFDLPEKGNDLDRVSAVMQAISHPTRLRILGVIGREEKIVTDILQEIGTTQSNVSQHVEVMRKAGVLQSRRVHNRVYCSVVDSDIFRVISSARECFCVERPEQGLPYQLVA